jgi:glycosyltransferase involved in cell wall biosynthesis
MLYISLLGWLIALFWLWNAGVVVHFLLAHQVTKIAASLPDVHQYPKLSIIVPARDEQQAIRKALSSLLALDYPEFEILAVNDRSSDQTGAIMDELSLESPRLKVLHIHELPDGWLGKTNAMHRAAQAATGDFLLFTDGDVIYAPAALKKIMQIVVLQQWDHLAVLPRLLPGDYAENSVTQFMGMIFMMALQPYRVANPDTGSYAGVGPFNLIHCDCYQQIGGFEHLRLEVVEDMALGREVKRHKFRSQVLLANEQIQFRWQQEVSGLIKGIEKNSFAAIDYSLVKLSIVTLMFFVVLLLPYWAIVGLPFNAAFGFSIAFLIFHGLLAFVGESAQVGWKITFACFFSVLVTLWALWRSAFLTLKQRGVYWRETFYPLAMLKAASRLSKRGLEK